MVPDEGSTPDPEALVAWCRERLAGYKRPRHIVFRDALPRTASGKVVKHELRSEYRSLGEGAERGAAT